MDVRKATDADRDALREVAEASLDASYVDVLGREVIDQAVEEWYDEDVLAEQLESEDYVYYVAEEEGDVVAFAECEIAADHGTFGEVYWLHVHPDHRGEEVGSELLSAVETALFDAGVSRIRARVLADNEEGNDFYAESGYQYLDERTVQIGDENHEENVYLKLADQEGPEDLVEERVTEEGETVFVAYDEREHGDAASFYAVFRTRDREQRYGYMCGNCDSFSTAMDSMGHIQCNDCGNTRKPTRWDAAYL